MDLALIGKWSSRLRTPIGIFVGNRLLLFLFVYLGLAMNPAVQSPWRAFPQNLMLDGWFRWDTGWYMRIVQTGYAFSPNEEQRPVNCFPLYPLIVRGLNHFTGNAYISGVVVSNVALAIACVLLHRLVQRKFGEAVASSTLTLMLCYPFSFFMSAMYTESLFLMATVGAFYFSERNRWLLASLCAAMAGATRVVGIIVTIPVFLMYLRRANWRPSGIRANAIWLLIAPLGLGSYMLFLYLKLGDPIAFYRAQWVPGWGASYTFDGMMRVVRAGLSWQNLVRGTFDVVAFTNVAFGALALFICVAGVRRLGWIPCLWGILTMIISFNIWGCVGRYSSVIWPMYVGMALVLCARPILRQSILGGFCLLQGLFALYFSHGLAVY